MRCTLAQIARVVEYALRAARARQNGEKSITLGEGDNAQWCDLGTGGMCARFVRQMVETACGITRGGWQYAAANAMDMASALDHAGTAVSAGSRRPGDIIGINRNSGTYGHIAIFVGPIDGQDMIVENTSSATRGNPRSPGTKLTQYSVIADRVTGVYRLAEAAIIVQRESGEVLTRRGELRGEELWVPAREVMTALGITRITDHLQDEGKVYVG